MKILLGTKNDHKIIEMTRIIKTYAKIMTKNLRYFRLKILMIELSLMKMVIHL